MKLSEILTGPETWCQGAMQRGEQRCLLGALELITNVKNSGHERERLRQIIERETGDLLPVRPALVGLHPVATWNDSVFRTWADIAQVSGAYDRDRMLRP